MGKRAYAIPHGRRELAGALKGQVSAARTASSTWAKPQARSKWPCPESAGVDLRVVEPTRLKRFATGNGLASKAEVLHAVKQVFKLDLGDDDDSADALMLARSRLGRLTTRSSYGGAVRLRWWRRSKAESLSAVPDGR
jgi:hypothetical protein